ncbi:MAG: D-glycerate dehydrogenase [Candidatus Magasanikbacteria bacterium]|nr:D-glycerate dehydrogenase [Candidatus Magasanikbacteria bacterium]
MPKYNIFVTRRIPVAGLTLLKKQGYKVKVSPHDRVLTKSELLKEMKGIDALLCLLTDKIDGEIMDAGSPRLKIIANFAVGFDNIDLKAAADRKLFISNTPGPEITESVAEFTVTLMMALARRVGEAERFIRAHKYRGWEPMLLIGQDLYGKTVGIVGLGRIGSGVARRLKNFGMKFIYNSQHRNLDFEKEFNARHLSLEALLKQADFVTLHVPLTRETHYLINRKNIKLMKKTAYLINTARGPVVEEKAVLQALSTKQIAGAALDVYECEPAIDCDLKDHMELRKLDNIIMTPHIASATIATRSEMSVTAARNIIAALQGKTPPNAVKSE